MHQEHVMDETRRRGRLVLHTLPILFIPMFAAGLAVLLLRLTGHALPPPTAEAAPHGNLAIAIIVGAVFLSALVVLVRLGRPTVSALLLIGSWTLITTMGMLRGGANVPAGLAPALFIVPICAAGLLIDGLASMSLAALATILMASMAWLRPQGIGVAVGQTLPATAAPVATVAPPLYAAAWSGLYWTVALLTSLLAGGLQRALQQSREQQRELRELGSQLEARVAAQTAELAQRATRAEALFEVTQALTSTLDLDRILSLITEQAAQLLGFDSAQVLLRQPDGSFAALGAYPAAAQDGTSGEARSEQVDFTLPAFKPMPALGEVASGHRPCVITFTRAGDGAAEAEPAGAALALPLHFGSRVAGLLLLTNADDRAQRGEDDLVLGQGLADQAAVAIANAQLLNEAREAATLEERTRLARDIHDTLAQGLTGVVVQLGATQRALATAPDQAREHLAVAMRMARESLAEARRSVWNLRQPTLQRGQLGDALRAFTIRPLGVDIAVTFEERGAPWALPADVESTLLRVAQEALTNVARHAQATEASILLEYRPEEARLRIQDNGIGLDPRVLDAARPASPGSGFGLLGMRERVGALGGRLEIDGHAGVEIDGHAGVEILAVVPRRGEPAAPSGDPSAGQPVSSQYVQGDQCRAARRNAREGAT